MKKLVLLLLALDLYSRITLPQNTSQLLLVSAENFESTQAVLQAYEKSKGTWQKVFSPIRVNLGRNGLAWGEGLMSFTNDRLNGEGRENAPGQNEPVKYEGDGKAPAGLFSLDLFFGYDEALFDFPYKRVNAQTLCIDESSSPLYTQIVQLEKSQLPSDEFKSFEYMKRNDGLYRLGILVGHNKKAIKERGSCIFVHIEKAEGSPTSGCTSLDEKELLKLMQWLERVKNPLLLQLPEVYLRQGFK
jgi:L,D-peptidoglycan transpeptidase YkuD (ErfK/YbiS/YcfS/YnhG family)